MNSIPCVAYWNKSSSDANTLKFPLTHLEPDCPNLFPTWQSASCSIGPQWIVTFGLPLAGEKLVNHDLITTRGCWPAPAPLFCVCVFLSERSHPTPIHCGWMGVVGRRDPVCLGIYSYTSANRTPFWHVIVHRARPRALSTSWWHSLQRYQGCQMYF